MMIRPVIRFSAATENGDVVIRFRTLAANEAQMMDLIDSLEFYLAPDSLTLIEGRRQNAWLHITVSVAGYEKEYVERVLRNLAWARNIDLIKVCEAEVELDWGL
jgi:hypothetical protein